MVLMLLVMTEVLLGPMSHTYQRGWQCSIQFATIYRYLAGIKNKCITLSNDAVLCPSSTEAVLDHLIGILSTNKNIY